MSDRYETRRKVAQGGAGVVYEAWDTQLERTVAIKMLRKVAPGENDTTGTQGTPDSLLREARSLSALHHPNIVSVYDVGEDESGNPFVVMEFLDGETLSRVVERAPLPLEDFRRVARQSLQGLIAAHRKGFLHRDLKPSNIMLVWHSDEEYQIKLLDFGLAKFSQEPVLQTVDQGGAVMGSIHFMAPEQFERAPLDERTDLYQLGCVFYYTLAGLYPFAGESAPEVMAAHLKHRVEPLEQRRPDLPRWLCLWVHELMKRDPGERPPTAEVALALLEREEELAVATVPDAEPGMKPGTRPAPQPAPTPQDAVTYAVTARVPEPTATPQATPAPSTTGTATTASGNLPGMGAPTSNVSVQAPAASGPGLPWLGVAAGVAIALAGAGVFYFLKQPSLPPSPPSVASEIAPSLPSHAASPSMPETDAPPRGVPEVASSPPAASTAPPDRLSPATAAASERTATAAIDPAPQTQEPAPNTSPVLDPFEVDAITAKLGQIITLEGEVSRIGESRSGKTRYINFSRVPGEAIAAAIHVEDLGDIFPLTRLHSWEGRPVRVRGVVKDVYGDILVYPESEADVEVLP